MPCLDGVIYFFLTIGVKLGDKIGVRNTVILTFVLHFSSYFILIFAKNFYLFLISMVMFGIGHAISNLAVIKNCWKYFPNNTGLVYGIIVSGAGMCSSIFTPLADFIVINPEKEKVDDMGFYPEYIANRLLRYLIIVSAILSVFGALSVFFTFNNEKEKQEIKSGKDMDNIKNENGNEKKENLVISEKKIKDENERESMPNWTAIESKRTSVQVSNKKLKEAFFSIKNAMFIYFCFGSFCKYILNLIIFTIYMYSFGFSYI